MSRIVAMPADFLEGDHRRLGRVLDGLEQLQERAFLGRVQLCDGLHLRGHGVAAEPSELREEAADLERREAGVTRLDLKRLNRIGESGTIDRLKVINHGSGRAGICAHGQYDTRSFQEMCSWQEFCSRLLPLNRPRRL